MKTLNKQLIIDFYAKVFGQGDIDFAKAVIAEDYIQHNPMVKTGREGFFEFMTMLSQLPQTKNPKPPFLRFIHEGDFVAVHSQVEFMGKENASLDLYRLEEGVISEHWDASQEIVNGSPKVKGSVEIDKIANTEQNKNLVRGFVQEVLIEKQLNCASKYLSSNLSIADFQMDYQDYKLHRLIGEKNFVLVQSEMKIAEDSWVQYDIYRLSDMQIEEHWTVKQIIPMQMVHDNGMI